MLIKVGIRKSEKNQDSSDIIGDYFLQMIFNEIEENKIGITAMSYELSFIIS